MRVYLNANMHCGGCGASLRYLGNGDIGPYSPNKAPFPEIAEFRCDFCKKACKVKMPYIDCKETHDATSE